MLGKRARTKKAARLTACRCDRDPARGRHRGACAPIVQAGGGRVSRSAATPRRPPSRRREQTHLLQAGRHPETESATDARRRGEDGLIIPRTRLRRKKNKTMASGAAAAAAPRTRRTSNPTAGAHAPQVRYTLTPSRPLAPHLGFFSHFPPSPALARSPRPRGREIIYHVRSCGVGVCGAVCCVCSVCWEGKGGGKGGTALPSGTRKRGRVDRGAGGAARIAWQHKNRTSIRSLCDATLR